ncbi:hypothetical protein M0R04_05275 [Candidatus Dojkabacteria bacterium]|jgi:hypothetical protein|nr:hypothetical protein [Candidatus Dojkabacteria bacterium]
MKLTPETLAILKNFGIINQGIHFKKGNTLKTVSTHKNILAQAEIIEDIPCDFGVYDLNNLLSVVSLHKVEPTFDFDDKHVVIVGNNGRSKIKYRFCDPSMIVTPPDKALAMPDPEINLELSSEDFIWIMRAASVLATPHIAIESNGSMIYITTIDLENDGAHTDSLELTGGNGSTYRMIFKTENLTKILPGSYNVKISSKGIAHFVNKIIPVQYWITIEAGSHYE